MNEPANAPHARAANLTILHDAQVTAVPKNSYPVHWRRTVITLPDHIDVSTASQIGEERLSVVNRGATALIADMTATVSCDHAGANAVVRAYQRAPVAGTQLRLVVTAQVVQRTPTLHGLDGLVPVYPSLKTATPAAAPTTSVPVMHEPDAPHVGQRRKLDRTTARWGKHEARDRPGPDWTVVLRRQPARMVEGRPEGGYTSMFEIICCHCGDQPDLGYSEVSPELQRIRGPYSIAAGVAAYQKHIWRHQNRQPIHQSGHPDPRCQRQLTGSTCRR